MPRDHRSAATVFILVTVLLDVLGLGIVIPVLPHLVADMVHEDTAAAARYFGLLTSTYAVLQFGLAPLLGALSDRFGRRPVLLLSLLGMSLSYLTMAFAPSLLWLFLARVVSGITGASFATANAYIADVTPPEKRAQSFGLVGATFGVGFVFGPAIGGALGHFDVRLPFFAAAFFAAANLIYGLFFLPESLPPERRRPVVWQRANPFGGVVALRRYPSVLGLAVVFVFASLAQRGMESVWVLYTQHRFGWHELDNGLALMLVGVGSIVTQGFLIRRIIPRLGERRTVLLGLLFIMAAMAGYGSASHGWMMLAVIPLGSLGALAFPSLQGLVSQSVPANEQGEVQGIFTALMSLTAVVAPIVATELLATFTSPTAPLALPGAPFFASVLFLAAAIAMTLGLFARHRAPASREKALAAQIPAPLAEHPTPGP